MSAGMKGLEEARDLLESRCKAIDLHYQRFPKSPDRTMEDTAKAIRLTADRIATLEAEVVRLQKEIDRWHTGKMTLITMANGRPCIMHWPDDPNAEVRDPDTGEVIFPAVRTPLRLVSPLAAGDE